MKYSESGWLGQVKMELPASSRGVVAGFRSAYNALMNAFLGYLAAIRKRFTAGDATEHTHRRALEAFLESVGRDITATNEPRRIACGSPDFQITRKGVPVGHVKTKDIGTDLDQTERGKGPHGEQFIRYRDGLPNWILTDYLQFRWFVNGEKRLTPQSANWIRAEKSGPRPMANRTWRNY